MHASTEELFWQVRADFKTWTRKTRKALRSMYSTPEHATAFALIYVDSWPEALHSKRTRLASVVADKCRVLTTLIDNLPAT